MVVAASLLWAGSSLAGAAPRRADAPSTGTAATGTAATGASAAAVLLPVSGGSSGGTASQRSVSALRVLDQTGDADDWDRYVEYGGRSAGTAYDGYVDLRAAGGTVDTSGGLTLVVNYRGPGAQLQRWTWSLRDRVGRAWVEVGGNDGVPGWDGWRRLEFAVPGTAARFVAADGSVRVRLTSSDATDDADVDYLAVVPSGGGAGPAPEPTATVAPPPTQPPPVAPAPGTVTLPPADGVFDYQIGGAYAPDADVDIVDRDHTAAPVPGRYNICYINGFQTQPKESGSWPSGALLRTSSGRLVEDKGWPGEYMLDTRTAASRDLVAGVVRRWITGCRDAGFDAVEIDNLDTFTRTSLLTKAGNLALAQQFVRDAHAVGLAIGQKNTVEVAAEGRRDVGFDFVVAESCQVYDECEDYIRVYGDQVYTVEYPDEGGRENFEEACAAHGARISVTYRDKNIAPRGRSGYVFEHC